MQGQTESWVLHNRAALIQNYCASADWYLVCIPLKHTSVHSVLHSSNWELPGTQIVGEMAQPLGKNTQFVQHAQLMQSKDMPMKYVFIDRFVCHKSQPLLLATFLLLFRHAPCLPSPAWVPRMGRWGGTLPAQQIPTSTGYDSSTTRQFQENESSALSFLSIFVIL